MRIEYHNLNGRRAKKTRVYDLPTINDDFWESVTDIDCPCCDGIIRWHEAGFVPGYRMCDKCKRHFLAKGHIGAIKLLRVGTRRN